MHYKLRTNLPTGSSNSFLMRHARRLQLNAIIKKVAIIVQASRNSFPELFTRLIVIDKSTDELILTYQMCINLYLNSENNAPYTIKNASINVIS